SQVFASSAVDLIYIGTRHDSHASLAAQALRAGKAVLCEKPISLTLEGLREVLQAQRESSAFLSVGYNRRYAPTSRALKSRLPAGVAKVINYTVSCGRVPKDHWTLDERAGGGRLLGECDHFFDLMGYFTDAEVVEVNAFHHADQSTPIWQALNFQVALRFDDGSLATFTYTDQAGAAQPRERVEVHSGGATLRIDDFNLLVDLSKGVKKLRAAKGLGHKQELDLVLRHLAGEQVQDIVGVSEVEEATLCSQAALRSMQLGRPVKLAELRAELAAGE
ncbi:MAG: Gfo/Idh/MocA family oxidoreductase, partial [Planctomycetes bacterium]|nr:Gfo/Idh/MocA family oxidoreductase [Planctomycetota bacterium]